LVDTSTAWERPRASNGRDGSPVYSRHKHRAVEAHPRPLCTYACMEARSQSVFDSKTSADDTCCRESGPSRTRITRQVTRLGRFTRCRCLLCLFLFKEFPRYLHIVAKPHLLSLVALRTHVAFGLVAVRGDATHCETNPRQHLKLLPHTRCPATSLCGSHKTGERPICPRRNETSRLSLGL